jgi:hypothetical protein
VSIVLKSGSLNLLGPSGPVKARNGIALPFLCCFKLSYVGFLYPTDVLVPAVLVNCKVPIIICKSSEINFQSHKYTNFHPIYIYSVINILVAKTPCHLLTLFNGYSNVHYRYINDFIFVQQRRFDSIKSTPFNLTFH